MQAPLHSAPSRHRSFSRLAKRGRRYWLLVSRPEYFAELEEAAKAGSVLEWSVPYELRPGDVALLYQTRPASEIGYALWARERARPDLRWKWVANFYPCLRLSTPVKLSELHANPRLAGWAALRRNFHGQLGNFAIPVPVWRVLRSMLLRRNPELHRPLTPGTRQKLAER